MINISIICVGKLKEQFLRDGCAEYLKRLSPYAKTQIIEIAEERASDNPSASEINNVLEKEGERIIQKIPKGAAVIPLCIEGREFSSPEFASEIEKISLGNSKIAL